MPCTTGDIEAIVVWGLVGFLWQFVWFRWLLTTEPRTTMLRVLLEMGIGLIVAFLLGWWVLDWIR